METRSPSCLEDAALLLETFLVEWKPSGYRCEKHNAEVLETFLVEWKPTPPLFTT